MKPGRVKTIGVLALSGTLIGIASGLVIYSPTLYRMFCNLTGFGGTVRRAAAPKAPVPADAKTITVYFDANVAPGLDWEFHPEQRKVVTHFGEPTRVNYYARNNSDKTVVARATFNVTPFKSAPYFFKIACFCFTNERLGPGESAKMPLVLYVDKQLLKDPNTRDVQEITLSYTFFKQKNLSPKEVAEARDLGKGSKKTDRRLKQNKPVDFDNDAPRR